MRSVWQWSIAVLALAVYIAGAVWFSNQMKTPPAGARISYEKARVLKINIETIGPDSEHNGLFEGFQDLTIRVLSGERSGTMLDTRNFLNLMSNFRLKAGDRIIIRVDLTDNRNPAVYVYSIDRTPALYFLVFLFILLLCLIGGKRGIRSVLGMVFTFTSIVFIFIPLLYRGYSPAFAAIIVSVATVCISLVFLDGFKVKTLSAILGSVSGLTVAAVLAFVFQHLTMVSGNTTSDADSLLVIAGQTGLKVGELLFAAVLIASIGAIMDIAISVASVVCEVNAANPRLGRTKLFRSGMNVGRDMMGTMANTLIMVFIGASLNALILIYSLEHSYYQILNSNAVVIVIIEALTGSLAVFLTVPAVAFIAAELSVSGTDIDN